MIVEIQAKQTKMNPSEEVKELRSLLEKEISLRKFAEGRLRGEVADIEEQLEFKIAESLRVLQDGMKSGTAESLRDLQDAIKSGNADRMERQEKIQTDVIQNFKEHVGIQMTDLRKTIAQQCQEKCSKSSESLQTWAKSSFTGFDAKVYNINQIFPKIWARFDALDKIITSSNGDLKDLKDQVAKMTGNLELEKKKNLALTTELRLTKKTLEDELAKLKGVNQDTFVQSTDAYRDQFNNLIRELEDRLTTEIKKPIQDQSHEKCRKSLDCMQKWSQTCFHNFEEKLLEMNQKIPKVLNTLNVTFQEKLDGFSKENAVNLEMERQKTVTGIEKKVAECLAELHVPSDTESELMKFVDSRLQEISVLMRDFFDKEVLPIISTHRRDKESVERASILDSKLKDFERSIVSKFVLPLPTFPNSMENHLTVPERQLYQERIRQFDQLDPSPVTINFKPQNRTTVAPVKDLVLSVKEPNLQDSITDAKELVIDDDQNSVSLHAEEKENQDPFLEDLDPVDLFLQEEIEFGPSLRCDPDVLVNHFERWQNKHTERFDKLVPSDRVRKILLNKIVALNGGNVAEVMTAMPKYNVWSGLNVRNQKCKAPELQQNTVHHPPRYESQKRKKPKFSHYPYKYSPSSSSSNPQPSSLAQSDQFHLTSYIPQKA